MRQVKVLVCQIVTAGKAHLTINDGNLPVIPVVHKNIEYRHQGIEYPALDAQLFHSFDKSQADEAHAAHVVVQQPHFHPLPDLLHQNLLQAVEGLGVLDGVVLHKDKVFRLPQGLLLGLQSPFRRGIILHIGILIGRKPGPSGEVAQLIGDPLVPLLHPGQHRLAVGQEVLGPLLEALKPPAHDTGTVGTI